MPLVHLHGTAEATEILALLPTAEKQDPALAPLNIASPELLLQVQILLHMPAVLAALLLASLTALYLAII